MLFSHSADFITCKSIKISISKTGTKNNTLSLPLHGLGKVITTLPNTNLKPLFHALLKYQEKFKILFLLFILNL